MFVVHLLEEKEAKTCSIAYMNSSGLTNCIFLLGSKKRWQTTSLSAIFTSGSKYMRDREPLKRNQAALELSTIYFVRQSIGMSL